MFDLVCLLKNKPPGLGNLWFPLSLYTEAGGMGMCPGSSGAGGCQCWDQEDSEASIGARLGSCPWWIPAMVAVPRHSGPLLAAPHVAPAGTPTVIPGCSPGLWDALQTAAGSESLSQPRAARSQCSPRPWCNALAQPRRVRCCVTARLQTVLRPVKVQDQI